MQHTVITVRAVHLFKNCFLFVTSRLFSNTCTQMSMTGTEGYICLDSLLLASTENPDVKDICLYMVCSSNLDVRGQVYVKLH